MQLGFVGLGKMGGNMVERLMGDGHKVVVFNKTEDKIQEYSEKGATPSNSLKGLVSSLDGRKVVWLMVPSGEAVDQNIRDLAPLLGKGDIIVDGGNSYYKETVARGNALREKGIYYIDCGTSGG